MQQKYLCFLAIFYLVLFSMKTAAAAGEAEFYLEPMIVAAARYDNSAGKPGYYKVDEKKLENGNYDNALDVIQQIPYNKNPELSIHTLNPCTAELTFRITCLSTDNRSKK